MEEKRGKRKTGREKKGRKLGDQKEKRNKRSQEKRQKRKREEILREKEEMGQRSQLSCKKKSSNGFRPEVKVAFSVLFILPFPFWKHFILKQTKPPNQRIDRKTNSGPHKYLPTTGA